MTYRRSGKLTVTFYKKYRSKKTPNEVALSSSHVTRRIKKVDVKAFLKEHFPQIKTYKIRTMTNPKYGSIALIRTRDKTWTT